MDNHVELRQLRYFVAVAEELHFGRAAARLHMAQPPLSQQIQKLELLIGAKLFDRTSRVVSLTAAGEAFLSRARRLLSQSAADIDEAARIGRGHAGRLDVGFVSSALVLGVVDRIHKFHVAHPDVVVQLSEEFTSVLCARVLDARLDVAFVRDAEPQATLKATTLFTEDFVAVVPLSHPDAGKRVIQASALRDDSFVFYPRAAGALAVRRNLQPCHDAGYEPQVVQEASNWATILHLVGAGLGVTIAPRSASVSAPANVHVARLDTTATSDVQLISRLADTRPVVRNFLAS